LVSTTTLSGIFFVGGGCQNFNGCVHPSTGGLDNSLISKTTNVVSVVNFLKYIVAEVVLFVIVTLKTLTFHKVV